MQSLLCRINLNQCRSPRARSCFQRYG